VTLTANGGSVTFTSVSAATGDFARTTNCAGTLTAGNSCTVDVTFTPTTTGARNGSITVTSSAAGSPQNITLSGTGVLAPVLGLSPGSLTFAGQTVDSTSDPQVVTITANNGSVTFTSVSTATGDFARTTNCSGTLTAGNSCTISVTFTPTVTGVRTGSITVTSNGAGSPQTIDLDGTGLDTLTI
jgi:flagellar basal body rod protein FlgF